MDYGFTQNDIILIFGHFMEKIKKLEDICNAVNATAPMKKDAQKQIKLFASITDKIRAQHPGFDLLAR